MSVNTRTTEAGERSPIWETVRVIIHALILALIVRLFLFQPFNIPSGSMQETLRIGDYLFVSKYSYGYSKYSFWGTVPFIDGRILAGSPERGDVAVFKLPRDTRTDYIKRVIGLPGDDVQMREGVLYINDEAVRKEPVDTVSVETDTGRLVTYDRFRETLANGTSYFVLDAGPRFGDNTKVFTVPEGHYFMMGDNRDNSADSRDPSVSFVPYENFVGRAEIIFFSSRARHRILQFWNWPSTIRWGRLFKLVR